MFSPLTIDSGEENSTLSYVKDGVTRVSMLLQVSFPSKMVRLVSILYMVAEAWFSVDDAP